MLSLRLSVRCSCCSCCGPGGGGGSDEDSLLQEDLFNVLQENGDLILLAETFATNALLTEAGEQFITESSDPIVTD